MVWAFSTFHFPAFASIHAKKRVFLALSGLFNKTCFMKKVLFTLLVLILSSCIFSCTDVDDTLKEPMLLVKFNFNPSQSRLGNQGQQTLQSTGHGVQTPIINTISAHYLELATDENTQFGTGTIIYKGAETTLGGSPAIDFDQAKIVGQDEIFLQIPLSQIKAGTYQWMRVSISYENFQINVRKDAQFKPTTVASFIGFSNYIGTTTIGNAIFPINANKQQGYWQFAVNDDPYSSSGQSPANSTTFPNPMFATSPMPAGSYAVSGKFDSPLVINGLEKFDITLTLSLSTNKSFDWIETNTPNGAFEPLNGETIFDTGFRGLYPTFEK